VSAVLEPNRADPTFEPAPCDGCARAERCAAKTLACAAFESFVVYGGTRWRGIERRCPSAAIYARVFPVHPSPHIDR
jgi:hypothetical protein